MNEVNINEIDLTLAIQLQAQFEEELRNQRLKEEKKIESLNKVGHKWNPKSKYLSEPDQEKLSVSLIDPCWELLDPNPNIFDLFLTFNHQFFWGRLMGVEVKWSPRMTLCAGVCSYEGRGGLCSVRLSTPLLKLRPRKDLIETLLHEMIHAYLFVTHNNTDHDGHGPQFHKHMHRINNLAGTKISVYHSFHNEVSAYRQHVWKCSGPCARRPPYFGLVKRSMNRAPSPRDPWWGQHARTCGGLYVKIKEPPGYGVKRKKEVSDTSVKDVRNFFPVNKGKKPKSLDSKKTKSVDSSKSKENVGVSGSSKRTGGNIRGLDSSSVSKNAGKVGHVGVQNAFNANVAGFNKSGNKGRPVKGDVASSSSVGSKTIVVKGKKTEVEEPSSKTEGSSSFAAFSGAGRSLANSSSSCKPGRSRLLSQFETGTGTRRQGDTSSSSATAKQDNGNSASQFGTNSGSTPRPDSPDDPETVCPMCQISIQSCQFEDHLAICLGDFDDEDFGIDLADCPAATSTVRGDNTVNTHTVDHNQNKKCLDGNLDREGQSTNGNGECYLSSKSKHVGLNRSVIDLLDDDDDDELLVVSVREAEKAFGNGTLASNVQGKNRNFHRCPVCNEKFSELEINTHVNQHFS